MRRLMHGGLVRATLCRFNFSAGEALSVERDSVFGEPILWSGRPKIVVVPNIYRVASAVCALASAIATTSAVMVATALGQRSGSLLAFAAWMATLSFGFSFIPKWWRSELEFSLTDHHLIVRRGKLRRSIETRSISFARIHWHPKHEGIGDLELVRAVPTGALRRRLSITMAGLVAPDRVWAIIRGVTPSTPTGGHRLLAQRLDDGERVLWAGHPPDHWRKWLPHSKQAWLTVLLSLAFIGLAAFTSVHAIHAVRTVTRAGMRPDSISFVALAVSLSLTIVLLVASAALCVYSAIVEPARMETRTRYLITDRRVLIQRGNEELHLDRSRIVDVIDAPSQAGLRDIFLVLDGPRARAVAASGAFGETQAKGLQPVLFRVADAEAIRTILLGGVPRAGGT